MTEEFARYCLNGKQRFTNVGTPHASAIGAFHPIAE
jgi:hypothetical protein